MHTHTHTPHTHIHIHTAHTHTTHKHYPHTHTHTCTAAHSEAASTLLELHALQDMLGVSGTETEATPVREDVETVEQQLAELEVNLHHTNCCHLL